MRLIRLTSMALAALVCGACGSNITCDEPKAYEAAREGVRVNAPEDLDQLEASRETPIPKASPRDPRPEGSPCLDLPPTVQSSSTSDVL